jgi:hypothetical protein
MWAYNTMKQYYDDDTSSLKSGLYLLAIILAFVALVAACFNEDDNVDDHTPSLYEGPAQPRNMQP